MRKKKNNKKKNKASSKKTSKAKKIVAKKKRGRPRKSDSSSNIKLKAAKKLKSNKTTSVEAPRRRGRPRKTPDNAVVVQEVPQKRGRGRPRKNPVNSLQVVQAVASNDAKIHMPKRRGRPRKNTGGHALAPASESVRQASVITKKHNTKRGRPSKEFLIEQRIQENMSLVESLARNFMSHVPAHIDRKDLISEGYIGLIEAARRFDPERGNKFETFARTRIQGAMFDWLRSLDLLPRSARDKLKNIEATSAALHKELGRPATDQEVANSLGVSLMDYQRSVANLNYKFVSFDVTPHNSSKTKDTFTTDLRDDSSADPIELIDSNKFWDWLKKTLDKIDEKERLVLSLMCTENLNLKEIGVILDYSPSTIRQIRERAMISFKEHIQLPR